MRFRIGVGLAVASTLLGAAEPPPLWSGAGADDLPVVLTPARLHQPQSQVPASVTVIDRELIDASGARELYQLLQLVPGMAAVKVDGNVPTVSYHPTHARDVRRMLVLIDGRSHYQPGLARVLWNDLPVEVEDVERIEVTRGPASAAYGANAFQGVINIITRHPAELDGTTVAVRGGNNGVRDWRLTGAHGEEGHALRFTLASRRDDGYDDVYFDTSSDVMRNVAMRDAKRVETFNLRSTWQTSVDDSFEFLAGASQSRLERTPEDSDFYVAMDFSDRPAEFAEQAFLQGVWEHRFSPRHQLKVQTYGQYTSGTSAFGGCLRLGPTSPADAGGAIFLTQEMRDLFELYGRDTGDTLDAFASAGPGTAPVYNRLAILYGSGAGPLCADFEIGIREERYDLEVQDTWSPTDWVRLVTGANLRLDRGRSDAYLDGTEENLSRRLFGNLELRLADPLLLNIGGYWEEDDLNGSFFSPRTALIWNYLPAQSIRVVVAEALRTPDIYEERANIHLVPLSLNEPYRSDAFALLGWENPEMFVTQMSDGSLEPEEITSREIGWFARIGPVEWDLRIFEEELRNTNAGGLTPFVFRPDNDGRVDIYGREAQVSWRPHPSHLLRATGAHIHTEADHPGGVSAWGIEVRLAARDSASLLWAWEMTPQWSFSLAGYLVHDYNSRTDENRASYERADARLAWQRSVGGADVNVSMTVQHDLTSDPVVFEENHYEDDGRYWVTAAVTF